MHTSERPTENCPNHLLKVTQLGSTRARTGTKALKINAVISLVPCPDIRLKFVPTLGPQLLLFGEIYCWSSSSLIMVWAPSLSLGASPNLGLHFCGVFCHIPQGWSAGHGPRPSSIVPRIPWSHPRPFLASTMPVCLYLLSQVDLVQLSHLAEGPWCWPVIPCTVLRLFLRPSWTSITYSRVLVWPCSVRFVLGSLSSCLFDSFLWEREVVMRD